MNIRSQFESLGFTCQRCGHHWQTRKPVKPAECPKCRTRLWNVQIIHKDDSAGAGSGDSNKQILQEITKKFLKKSENGSTIVKELNKLELEHALEQAQLAFTSRDWAKMEDAMKRLEQAINRAIESVST